MTIVKGPILRPATAAVIWLLTASLANAATIFVNSAAVGPGDGLTWPSAFTNLQSAIALSTFGDQIWVASGDYVGYFLPKDGVSLFGGFSGTETNLTQRNWTNNLSCLDGTNGPPTVEFSANISSAARIDGFIIRHANSFFGEGVICVSNSSPVIANNTITGNRGSSGGGIFCSSASPVVINNLICSNSSLFEGGGISSAYNSTPVIANNFIGFNQATFKGGGIYYETTPGIITNNVIIGNLSGIDGGAGICCNNAGPLIANNLIQGNALTNVIYASTGCGIACVGSSSPMILNNVINANFSGESSTSPSLGGGIYCDGGSLAVIINNSVINNASDLGGGIYCVSNQVTLVNNLVADNSSGIAGLDGLVFSHNCVYGNGTANFSGLTDPTGTNGNIAVDPQLPAGAAYGEFHLQPSSPCRDAGDSSVVQPGWTDIDGQPRIQGAAVDIGADESDGSFYGPPLIIRVSAAGNDNNDGSSWALAKRTVQGGINAVGRGGEVWVRAGTYPERIAVPAFTYLFGGFAGTETNRSLRNWQTNASTVDGMLGGSVVTLSFMNSYGCLDGFTITNGSALVGSGVNCLFSTVPIVNNTIVSNLGPIINTASGGGGIYCAGGCMICNNIIANNRAWYGAGIGSTYGRLIIANNVITNNLADESQYYTNSAAVTSGAAIYTDGFGSTIIDNLIARNVFTDNHSHLGTGSAVFCEGTSQVINNTILRNTAGSAPVFNGVDVALYAQINAPGLIANNLIAFNAAGIFDLGGDPSLIQNNCVFGSVGNDYFAPLNYQSGVGNISVDPLLADFNDPHLTAASPCRDAGANGAVQAGWTDVYGNPRIFGSAVDIGALEYNGVVPPVTRAVFHVSPGGNDANDGLSWATPKAGIQAAINAAALLGGEVWVQSGAYPVSATVPAGVYLYGGFSGSESSRSQRNWINNPAILNAAGTTNILSAVRTFSYAAISGFTIQNAFAGNTNSAIATDIYSACLIANNCIIHNNAYAISCAGSPIIADNLIAGNKSNNTTRKVGGIYCRASSAPLIVNNTIVGNSGADAGGIYCANSGATMVNNLVAFGSSGITGSFGPPQQTLRNNCVFGNTGFATNATTAGTNSIFTDPMLFDTNRNFFLLPGSPCINAGDPSVVQPDWLDAYGRARLQNGLVDIGAFESQSVAEWLPLVYQPAISMTTVGGISYAGYSAAFTNSAFQLLPLSPVSLAGTNFSQSFNFQWYTGASQPVPTTFAGDIPLGLLANGGYAFLSQSWGATVGTNLFSVLADGSQTLSNAFTAADGTFQMDVAGVPGADYVIQATTDFVDWTSVQTNHGAPFTFTDPAAATQPRRFYRVLVLP